MGRRTLVAALLAACLASGANAQDFPTRPITLVAPFPPGGPSDTTARLVAIHMSKALGQPVVVENVTGAGGTIGSNRVAKAAPDGYQIVVSGSGTHAAIEYLHKEPPYKSGDWEHIGLINVSPVVLVAKRDVPANTLAEFIAYLRANEKKVTEADAGVGSISNLACSVFHSLANVNPDRRVVSGNAAGDAGRGRWHRGLRLQPDRQHRAACADRCAEGVCRHERQTLVHAAERTDHG